MAESTDSQENGRFDNDFEKLSHTDEEIVNSSLAAGRVQELQVGSQPTDSVSQVSDVAAPVEEQMATGEPAYKPIATKCALFGEATSKTSTSCCISNLDLKLCELILWRDVRKSCVVFVGSLLVLLSFSLFSALSVLSYLSLALLSATFTFRFYWHAMCTVKKTPLESPLKKYLEMDLSVSDTTVDRYADIVARHTTVFIVEARRLLLVENVTDSLKCALVLWLLTYVGGWFNGLTLLLIGDLLLFTLPKLYDVYKVEVDNIVEKLSNKTRDIYKKVEERIPMLSKKKQA